MDITRLKKILLVVARELYDQMFVSDEEELIKQGFGSFNDWFEGMMEIWAEEALNE